MRDKESARRASSNGPWTEQTSAFKNAAELVPHRQSYGARCPWQTPQQETPPRLPQKPPTRTGGPRWRQGAEPEPRLREAAGSTSPGWGGLAPPRGSTAAPHPSTLHRAGEGAPGDQARLVPGVTKAGIKCRRPQPLWQQTHLQGPKVTRDQPCEAQAQGVGNVSLSRLPPGLLTAFYTKRS